MRQTATKTGMQGLSKHCHLFFGGGEGGKGGEQDFNYGTDEDAVVLY